MPDVRWCHPSIRRASHPRREGKHLLGFRACAVAHGALFVRRGGGTVGSPPFSPRARGRAGSSRTSWRSNIRGGLLHSRREPFEGQCLSGTAYLPIAFCCGLLQRVVVGRRSWCFDIPEGSEMGHEKNHERAHSSLQRSTGAPDVSNPNTLVLAASRNDGQAQAAPPNPGMQRTRCARR